jgi:NAD+ synthase
MNSFFTNASNEELMALDYDAEIEKIGQGIKKALRQLRKRGAVVAMSGGIDSSVTSSVAAKTLGKDKVFGLLLPEQDSSSKSSSLGQILAEHLGIEFELHNIAPSLDAIGCYKWRDAAIKKLFPDYGPGWKNKIAISGGTEGLVNSFQLIVQSPDGKMHQSRLGVQEYLQIVAATNFKQRTRKMVEYFHADRLNYAVLGTPNRVEYDQGFFVRNGDGAADIKPIAHLYKTQVYALARHMQLPDSICNVIPTTDTYSLPQGQDEFYYALPYHQMDIALFLLNNKRPAQELADRLQLSLAQAEFVYKDIETKRRTTAPLHWSPILMEKVDGPITDYDY